MPWSIDILLEGGPPPFDGSLWDAVLDSDSEPPKLLWAYRCSKHCTGHLTAYLEETPIKRTVVYQYDREHEDMEHTVVYVVGDTRPPERELEARELVTAGAMYVDGEKRADVTGWQFVLPRIAPPV